MIEASQLRLPFWHLYYIYKQRKWRNLTIDFWDQKKAIRINLWCFQRLVFILDSSLCCNQSRPKKINDNNTIIMNKIEKKGIFWKNSSIFASCFYFSFYLFNTGMQKRSRKWYLIHLSYSFSSLNWSMKFTS